MIWLKVKQAAELENVNERTIRRNIEKYHYCCINGVGGKKGVQYQIQLSSLSKSAQNKYYGQVAQNEQEFEQELLSLTEAQRDKYFVKIAAVRGYQDFKADYTQANKMVDYLRQYNDAHPECPLTERQLNHWEHLYKRDGVEGLIDRRGTWNKGISSIEEDVKNTFLSFWLQEKGTHFGGPSIASCYKLTQKRFPDRTLPHVMTFQRMTKNLFKPLKTLKREGTKAYKDKCEPYIRRNYENIHTNQQWVADNHVFDVLVRFPDGHVGRPWVVGFMDMSSRYITGFYIIEGDPNADHILDAFIKAVSEYCIPEKVQLDNGKDFTVHDLFNRDNVYSLAREMNFEVTNAIKYNAKAKNIERVFETIEYSYCIHLSSYIGSNPQKRPERLKKTNDKLTKEAIPFDEFKDFMLYAVNDYNNSPHSGNGMNGRTPCAAFEENVTVPLKIVPQDLLAIYYHRRTKLLTVGRNGIKISELNQEYDSTQLFLYQGKKVYARYKTTDIRTVYCFTEDGSYICTAESVPLGELNQEMTAQQMRELNNKKKKRKQIINELMLDIKAPSIQQLAIQSGKSFNKPDLKLLPSVVAADPKKQKEAKIMREEEKRADTSAKQKPIEQIDSEELNKKLARRFNVI